METNKLENEARYLEEATRFAEANIVPAVEGRVCVDGRYLHDGQQKGFLARAGGDMGYVMGLLGLRKEGKINMTIQECVDTVYNFVTQDNETFYAHTDAHSVEDKTLTGCGHAGRAANPDTSEMFGVNAEDVEEALVYLRNKEQHPKVDEVVLTGTHGEKGVLIVKGKQKTLQHQYGDNQYFVYDKDRDDEFVNKFAEFTHILNFNREDYKQILEQQTNATVALLAQEKPIIEINLTEENPILTFIAMVPPLAE